MRTIPKSLPSKLTGLAAGLALAWSAGAFLPADHSVPFELPLLWPEEQRAFLQDGPGLLLSRERLAEVIDLDRVGRQAFIDRFYADPLPATEPNELREGVRRRTLLVRRDYLSFLDDRARVLFLHGAPDRRELIDCLETFKPLELWTYTDDFGLETTLVLYQDNPGEPFKLWIPLDSKRVLYNTEMEYWLEQWEELRSRISGGRRFDRTICPRSFEIDRVTGVDGLFGFLPDRPSNQDMLTWLQPPKDLARWSAVAASDPMTVPEGIVIDRRTARRMERQARKGRDPWTVPVPSADDDEGELEDDPAGDAAGDPDAEREADPGAADAAEGGADAANGSPGDDGEELPEYTGEWPPPIGWGELEVVYPERRGQRMLTRLMVTIPPEVPLETFAEGRKKELRLTLEGQIEHEGKRFESFRIRFLMTPPEEGVPVALAADRLLRPEQDFLARLKITDEISGTHFWLNRGFMVPRTPTPASDLPPISEEAIQSITDNLKKERVGGYDSLILVPPESEVIFGLWRAEALVTGHKIEKVTFFLDDQPQMSRRRPPFTAELRLDTFPREQVVRAEGYDTEDQLVASDEVILNQPRGQLKVRILEPARGATGLAGEVAARAEVVVPEEARVERVTFAVNEEQQAEVTKPPWAATLQLPEFAVATDLTYLTVAAILEDGSRAEDVRFLNAPRDLDVVDVNLVELYTTVTDKSGAIIQGLTASDFAILEDSRPQEVVKFELVDNLPLTLGIVIDASGSMFESMGEAQRAATGFVEKIITPRDRVFALSFSDKPILLMPRTSDAGAVTQAIEGVLADGATSLHDAIVTSLYYYRGIRGRRAMVILSDGEDTSSTLGFQESLEYAKRSGVAVYAIGLNIGKGEVGVRRKLNTLAEETGGRTFYIKEAAELSGTYAEIERELRSQYLIAYNSDRSHAPGTYHEIVIKVKGGKLKGRTMKGYYS